MRLILPIILTSSIVVHTLTSCSFGSDDPSLSSSSVTKIPKSSSSKIPSSSSSSIDCSIISSSSNISEDLCSDFDSNAEIEHYGKMKKQFCDKRDGKKYVYVQIGKQIWMAENLNYAVCGSKCGSGGNSSSLEDANTVNCDKYGRLYDWATALTVCPDGWHLPSDEEWTALTDYAGNSIAGKKLKTASGWILPYGANCVPFGKNPPSGADYISCGINGTDDYGFSALPGGYGSTELDRFNYLYLIGLWWSATEFTSRSAYYRAIHHDSNGMASFRSGKTDFLSVRCVRD